MGWLEEEFYIIPENGNYKCKARGRFDDDSSATPIFEYSEIIYLGCDFGCLATNAGFELDNLSRRKINRDKMKYFSALKETMRKNMIDPDYYKSIDILCFSDDYIELFRSALEMVIGREFLESNATVQLALMDYLKEYKNIYEKMTKKNLSKKDIKDLMCFCLSLSEANALMNKKFSTFI